MGTLQHEMPQKRRGGYSSYLRMRDSLVDELLVKLLALLHDVILLKQLLKGEVFRVQQILDGGCVREAHAPKHCACLFEEEEAQDPAAEAGRCPRQSRLALGHRPGNILARRRPQNPAHRPAVSCSSLLALYPLQPPPSSKGQPALHRACAVGALLELPPVG